MNRLLISGIIILTLAGCLSWKPFTSHQTPEAGPGQRPVAREARGIWLHRFEYCNSAFNHNQDSIRHYIRRVIRRASDANFNMIFFQVRGNGDAYYTPGLEPWGSELTGTLGRDPGWDPLQFALREAHRSGLELHAWVNTFPAWRGISPPPETTPRMAILDHPEWVVSDSGGSPMPSSGHYTSFSPGIPAVHDYIISVVTDIVDRYAVDGIHFDYIRYPEDAPEHGYSHDSISVSRFRSQNGNPYALSWEDWQREQLNQFVYKVYNAITAADPVVKVSAAVIGAYNTGSWNAYNAVYQDPRRWTEMGKMDFIVPMTYWERSHPTHSFVTLTAEWQDRYLVDRPMFAGIGSYRFGPVNGLDWHEAEAQISHLRREQIPGMVFFDARSLEGHWKSLATKQFRYPAVPPAMPWKTIPRPEPLEQIESSRQGNQLNLSWRQPPDRSSAWRYLIYLAEHSSVDSSSAVDLRAVIPGDTTRWSLQLSESPDSSAVVGISVMNQAYEESKTLVSRLGNRRDDRSPGTRFAP